MKKIIPVVLLLVVISAAMFCLGYTNGAKAERNRQATNLEERSAAIIDEFTEMAKRNRWRAMTVEKTEIDPEKDRSETVVVLECDLIDDKYNLTILTWTILITVEPGSTTYRCWSGKCDLAGWESALKAYAEQEGITDEMPKPDPDFINAW